MHFHNTTQNNISFTINWNACALYTLTPLGQKSMLSLYIDRVFPTGNNCHIYVSTYQSTLIKGSTVIELYIMHLRQFVPSYRWTWAVLHGDHPQVASTPASCHAPSALSQCRWAPPECRLHRAAGGWSAVVSSLN